MLETLRRIMLRLRADGQEEIRTPAHQDATFVLRYGDLEVGSLRLHAGVWEFRYSQAFQEQSDVQPLIDFPDVSKPYQAEALWPFFLARIPSVAQPKVKAVISAEGLDEHSDVDLLRFFGKKTIGNPFILVAG